MDYLSYLKLPHFIALLCSIISCIVVFAESKYSKTKYSYKYYIKIFLIVIINVYLVLLLVKKGIIPLDCKSISNTGSSMKGGGDVSSINTSNYNAVDIGNPNF